MSLIDDGFCSRQCTGFCCSSYVVLITSEDAIRILENTNLHPYDFLEIYEGSVEKMGFYPIIKIMNQDAVLGIKYRPETTTCYFHDEKTGLCTIHEFKPMVCATYPFSMDWEENLYHLKDILCPQKWWPESEEMKEVFKKSIRKSWEEGEIYKQKAKTWNEQHPDGTFGIFLKHIGIKYGKYQL
ncbi:MAG: YkgJ family cysteine cluster protein [Candidatus Lokiarchaeota archaeon]|nr:YkgJ family cysteine cluster protein [Candidatus Lokiarchaeota archaeon]